MTELFKQICQGILTTTQWLWMIYSGLGQAIGIPEWILIAIPIVMVLFTIYKIFEK